MPLNLTRTVATRGVRLFSHQTWVSGSRIHMLLSSSFYPKTEAYLSFIVSLPIFKGPPRTRIPFAEKVAHGLIISVGVLTGPMWILGMVTENSFIWLNCNKRIVFSVHIEDYKKRD
jgi:hypothetical protein